MYELNGKCENCVRCKLCHVMKALRTFFFNQIKIPLKTYTSTNNISSSSRKIAFELKIIINHVYILFP